MKNCAIRDAMAQLKMKWRNYVGANTNAYNLIDNLQDNVQSRFNLTDKIIVNLSEASILYPFCSPEVKDIYDHLTADELARIQKYSVKTGIVAGLLPFLVLFLPLFFLARFLIAHFGIPESLLLMLVIAIPIGVFVGWIGFAPTRKKASQLLCDTAYAKQLSLIHI